MERLFAEKLLHPGNTLGKPPLPNNPQNNCSFRIQIPFVQHQPGSLETRGQKGHGHQKNGVGSGKNPINISHLNKANQPAKQEKDT